MKHFRFLNESESNKLFYKKPMNFDNESSKDFLQYALGSLLYMPADETFLSDVVINKKYLELTSMCWCLEDAVNDDNLELAEQNVITHLNNINNALKENIINKEDIPLIFVRVRNKSQLKRLLNKLKKNKESRLFLTGFILPKFNSITAINYLEEIYHYNRTQEHNLYVMPILESELIMYKENRISELLNIKQVLSNERYNNFILNVRVGATDFSSLFGLRRSIDFTIYDMSVIRDVLLDIINVFGRQENKFIISGPVWEFFDKSDHDHRLLKPTLRETPFKNNNKDRNKILGQAIDGLIKEVAMDKANGFCGKTTIHPSHVKYINAIQIITEEEYEDALKILNSNGSGVHKGSGGNKMNEVKPHTNWARNIILKAEVYGVLRKNINYAELY